MRWTVDGANAIIALRCCQLSNRWEEFWELPRQLSPGHRSPTNLAHTPVHRPHFSDAAHALSDWRW